MNDTVVILGNYEGTRELFDWDRTDCDIWVLNEMLSNQNPAERWVKRADAVFQLHAEPIWRNPMNRTDPGHVTWLKTQTETPVYMQKNFQDVPMSVAYPLEAIKGALLNQYNIKNVFSSTLSYCMALAIYKGYRQIETYGVEMGTETEYFHQREGFTFWVGYACGRGIKVRTETTQLLKAPLYGYEGEVTLPYSTFTKRVEELAGHVKELESQYLAKRAETAAALLALKNKANDENVQRVINSINEQNQAAVSYAIQEGGRQHNERMVVKADAMRNETGGEFIFSRQEFESARLSLQNAHTAQVLTAQSYSTQCGLALQAVTKASTKANRSKRIEQLALAIELYVRANVEAGMMAGSVAECVTYLRRLDAGIRAAGGEKSAEVLMAQVTL